MPKPYSTTAQVLNQSLQALISQAAWNVTELTGDVAARIAEGDNEIDQRLAAMGFSLPFATNPSALQDLSVLYGRYACLRDLFTENSPATISKMMDEYKIRFEEELMRMEEGWSVLVDANGGVISGSKFTPLTTPYPSNGESPMRDNYPNYPQGPYPDPVSVDSD